MAWYEVYIEGATPSGLGATTLSEAVRVALETRKQLPHLRTLTILDEQGRQVWQESNGIFDIETLKTVVREGAVILGSKGCGKTNTCMVLANDLRNHGAIIRAFDSSLQWKRRSDFKTYDLSTYTCAYMQRVVNETCRDYFWKFVNFAKQGITTRPLVLVFEEIQNLIGTNQLRAKSNMEVLRYFSQGRNYNCSYVAISQKPQLVDSNIIELAGVRIFMCSHGDRTRRKLGAWLDKAQLKQLADFKRGMALLRIGNDTRFIEVPKYRIVLNTTKTVDSLTHSYPTVQSIVSYRRIRERTVAKEEALKILSELKDEENWGNLSFQHVDFEKGFGKVLIIDSFETVARKTSQPCCHFFRGFLAGFLSELFGKTIQISEEKCAGKGDEHCEFIFSTEASLDENVENVTVREGHGYRDVTYGLSSAFHLFY